MHGVTGPPPLRVGQSRLGEISRRGGPVPTYDRRRLEPRIVHVGVAGALAVRRDRGFGPLTILSCDNLPGNGTAARRATLAAAARVDPALADWVRENCVFPNSMVDRITPATTDADRAWLHESAGID